jgi:hypothetical protein
MIIEPGKAFVMGGTYKIPVLMGLLEKGYIDDLKRDDTFNEMTFEREYLSKWSGTVDDAYFNGDAFDNNRKIMKPEYEYSGRSNPHSYYIVSIDVGRKGDQSVVSVIKAQPMPDGTIIKSLVNIITMNDMHFED